jgi:hypothetical protein
MNKRFWACGLLLCGTVIAISAQTVAPPEAPFIKMPAPGSQWNITITQASSTPTGTAAPPTGAGQGAAGLPFVPTSIAVEMNRAGLIQETIQYANKQSETCYFYKGRLLVQASNSNRIFVLPFDQTTLSPNVFDVERPLPGVQWVELPYYTGAETTERTPCYVFHVRGLPHTGLPQDFELGAWVSQATGFPVKAQVGNNVYHYSVPQPFSQKIEVPEPYAAALKGIGGG